MQEALENSLHQKSDVRITLYAIFLPDKQIFTP